MQFKGLQHMLGQAVHNLECTCVQVMKNLNLAKNKNSAFVQNT